jgi:hypothetical protein
VPRRYRLHWLAHVLVVYLFWLLSDLLISIVFAIGDEGIDASHGRDAPVIGLMEPSTEDNKVLINCLEHVSLRGGLVLVLDDCCFVLDVCFSTQALVLSNDLATKRALRGCTTEVHHQVGEGECQAEGRVVSIDYKIEEMEL